MFLQKFQVGEFLVFIFNTNTKLYNHRRTCGPFILAWGRRLILLEISQNTSFKNLKRANENYRQPPRLSNSVKKVYGLGKPDINYFWTTRGDVCSHIFSCALLIPFLHNIFFFGTHVIWRYIFVKLASILFEISVLQTDRLTKRRIYNSSNFYNNHQKLS